MVMFNSHVKWHQPCFRGPLKRHHIETSPFPPSKSPSGKATAWNRWWLGRRFRVPGATPATKSWKRRLRAAWWSVETPNGRGHNATMLVKSWIMVTWLTHCTLNIMFNIREHPRTTNGWTCRIMSNPSFVLVKPWQVGRVRSHSS